MGECGYCGSREGLYSPASTRCWNVAECDARVAEREIGALRAALEEARGALSGAATYRDPDRPCCVANESEGAAALASVRRALGVPPGVTGLVTNPELLRAHRGIELLRDSVRLFHSATCAGVENKCHACEPTSSDVFLERQIGPPGVTTKTEGP